MESRYKERMLLDASRFSDLCVGEESYYKLARESKELQLYFIAINPLILRYASSDIQGDFFTVQWAVRRDGRALCFAMPRMQKNKKIVEWAVWENARAVEFADKTILTDKQFLKKLTMNDGVLYNTRLSKCIRKALRKQRSNVN
jgi:hypothetical protein